MSARRQTFWRNVLATAAISAAAMLISTFPGWPAATEPSGPYINDPQTGLAIAGFDPVAYFTGAGAILGHPQIEYRYADTTWRFRNDGNRAAFASHPDVYAPRFGGYDPVAIARGVTVAGNPMTWAISGNRLYLFYDRTSQRDFVAEPERAIEAAERKWPDLQRALP